MGRPRTRHKDLPPGVRRIAGRYYWTPTTPAARTKRREQGHKTTLPLGADAFEMRKRWAELNPVVEAPADGTIAYLIERYRDEELDRINPATRMHFRTESTRKEYRRQLRKLEQRFGARRYARNAVEASAGGDAVLRRMDVVRMLRDSKTPTQANKDAVVLSVVFEYARDCGLVEYNPVEGVAGNTEIPRDREPLPWELEVLITAAPPLFALILRFIRVTAWRGVEVRELKRTQLEAAGIRITRAKGGTKELWEWTPQLRAIVDDAKALRGSLRSLTYVFCTRKGTALTKWGYQELWRKTKRRANRWLEETGLPKIENLRPHDMRSKAIDDAEERRRDGVRFSGNASEGMTRRHYLRRAKRQRALE